MTKRALLILIGGRQVPNVLTAQALKPDLIVPIASKEAMEPRGAWENVAPALRRLCPHGLREPVVVDAFECRETYQACRQALFDTQDAEWVVNVSCGPKVMGFGVYDAAMPDDLPMSVSIWYLDTASRRSVVLKGRKPEVNLYRLTVADYFAAYGRKPSGSNPRPGEVNFAKLMASDLRSAARFTKGIRDVDLNSGVISFDPSPENLPELLESARAAGYVQSFRVIEETGRPGQDRRRDCEVLESPGKSLEKFVTGGWLEVYAWWAAHEAGCFDDVRCGLEIHNAGASNELDLAATRGATLLVAECKTGYRDFKQIKEDRCIEKLHSIAELVGGNYVGRLLITSLCEPEDSSGKQSYNAYCEQARARQVVVVTGDQLKDLPNILKRESGDRPAYRYM